MQTLILIRGLPGSGKSTLAAKISAEMNIPYIENDMFMYEDGVYVWTPEKLTMAIDKCHEFVVSKLEANEPVIVNGVFSRWASIRDYVELAQDYDYKIKIIHCKGEYGSIHNVPQESIDRMRNQFVANSDLPHKDGIEYEEYPRNKS